MKAGDQMKQGGFSATRWSYNAEKLAGLDLQINVFERHQPIIGIRGVA
jgi:hypothetical protein